MIEEQEGNHLTLHKFSQEELLKFERKEKVGERI